MKKIIFLFIFIIPFLFSSCELYPKWDKDLKYSDAYPICGEYYVYDYEENGDFIDEESPYILYIYNKSYNPTKDSIWIDNKIGHPIGGGAEEYPYAYKIKTKADINNLTFNCIKNGTVVGLNINPLDSARTVTIVDSKIIDYDPGDITSAKPDSIYFKISLFDKFGVLEKTFVTAGHRKTGWEDPNSDDDM